jgi:RNA polymerase sigma-70 factor (ECF subfamily)
VDDRLLVRRMLRGDESAFETFFDAHASRLYRFADARLRDPDAAEEVVQATFVKAFRYLSSFRWEASLYSWLCTICRHEIGALLARRHRSADVPLTTDLPEIRALLDALAAADSTRPDEAFHRQELGRLIQETLDYLPARYGDVLEWKYVHGLSMQAIAERLQTTPKAIESMLARARSAFREAFETLTRPSSNAPMPIRRTDG